MALPAGVRDAVVNAYYRRALKLPDVARERAQAAYVIAAALTTALAAAGILGNIDRSPTAVLLLGIAALISWLTTAGLFAVAVSAPFAPAADDASDDEEFVRAVLSDAVSEAAAVDRWQGRARIVACIAVALTFGAALSSLKAPPPATSSATIFFTQSGTKLMSVACGTRFLRLNVEIETASIASQFVRFTVPPLTCTHSTRIALPRADIQAVFFKPGAGS